MRYLDSKTTLPTLALALLAASVLAFAQPCSAATPNVIGYQGRVLVTGGTVPFTGSGKFQFALVDASNAIVWNSDAGVSSSAPNPNNVVTIAVNNGLYSVLIGNQTNTPANPYTMGLLPATVFANNTALSLRVYFTDGTVPTPQQLMPDQPIAAVGYAVVATNAITATNLSGGTVGATVADNNPAIYSDATGPGIAVRGRLSGASGNIGGFFEVVNPSCAGVALSGSTVGTGSAGSFQVTNTANTGSALVVTSNGAGNANGNGTALAVTNSGMSTGASISNTNSANLSNTLYINTASTSSQTSTLRIDVPAGGPNFIQMRSGTTFVATISNNGNYNNPSDARLKTNIVLIPNALQKIKAIRGVTYDWKDNRNPEDKHDVGVIAQEVLPVLPEAVSKGSNGFYSVAYSKLIPVLVEAVKELNTRHDSDVRRIEQLEKQNAAMEARMSALEKAGK